MKKILLVSLVFLFVGFSCKKEQYSYNIISSEEAKLMMDENTEEIVLDVRSREAYNERHIAGAINISYYELENRFSKEVTTDKNALILIYCQSGNLSKDSFVLLEELGYTNLYVFGSINDWKYEIIE